MSTSTTLQKRLWRPGMMAAGLVVMMTVSSGAAARAGDDPSLIPDDIEHAEFYERFDALASMNKTVPKNPDDYYDENGNFNQEKYEHDLKHHPEWFEEVPLLWWLAQLVTQANASSEASKGGRSSDGDGGSPTADSLWNDVDLAGATPIEPAFTLLPPAVHFGAETVNPLDAVHRPDPVRFGQFGNGFGASPGRPGAVGTAGGR